MIFKAFVDMIEIGMKQTKALKESEQAVLEPIQGRRKHYVKLRRRIGKVPTEFGN